MDKERRSLTELAGKWVGDAEELDRIFEEILEERKTARLRKVDIGSIKTR